MAKSIDQSGQLHVAFFPFMAPGHTIPMLYTARMFAARGVKTTILTTPLNAPSFNEFLGINNSQTNIHIEVIPFPSEESGLPKGVENLASCTSSHEMSLKFMLSLRFFKEPLEKFLEKTRPDCLVAGTCYPFANCVAAKFGIPRIVFRGSNVISACMINAVWEYEPHKNVRADDEPFVIPHLPHKIIMTRSQLSPDMRGLTSNSNEMVVALGKYHDDVHEAEVNSYGVLFNSVYEIEPDYVEFYRKVFGRRTWHIGPVSLFKIRDDKNEEEYECIKWLDSKEPNSVAYICFGSLTGFSASQVVQEIAKGLEGSRHQFVWVIKKSNKDGNEEKWLPNGFEKKMQDKGIIIRGWAPQAMILRHPAVGGFVTHCGWNSIFESILSGVPLVTAPLFTDHFSNEVLVTKVLKIGVPLEDGVDTLMREKIKTALDRIMVGKEALEMRTRTNKIKEMALKAVEEGGSSFNDLSSLIQELKCYRP